MLEQFKPQRITWDCAHQYIHERINANQGDSNGRVLEVQVLNGGQTEDLGSSTLSLGWRTKSGEHEGLDAFAVKDASIGLYEISFTTAMLSHAGKLTASLVLVTTSGRVQSNPFTINNVRSVVSDDAAQGENSFTALTQALVNVNAFDQKIEDYKSETTAQLAQKVGDGVNADPEDLSDTLLGMITGTGGPINLLSIPQDKSVTPEKTTFARQSKNLYNKNTSVDNVKLDTDGEAIPQSPDVAESDIRTTSDFIPILGDTTYSVNEQMYLQVYGEDKNAIGGLRDHDIDTPLDSVGTARYVRVTIRKSEKETFQFEQSSVPTEYEPYGLIIKDLIVDGFSKFMTEENEGWAI